MHKHASFFCSCTSSEPHLDIIKQLFPSQLSHRRYINSIDRTAPRHNITPRQSPCSSSQFSASASSPLQPASARPRWDHTVPASPRTRLVGACPSISPMARPAAAMLSSRRLTGLSPTSPPSRPTLRQTASATCEFGGRPKIAVRTVTDTVLQSIQLRGRQPRTRLEDQLQQLPPSRLQRHRRQRQVPPLR